MLRVILRVEGARGIGSFLVVVLGAVMAAREAALGFSLCGRSEEISADNPSRQCSALSAPGAINDHTRFCVTNFISTPLCCCAGDNSDDDDNDDAPRIRTDSSDESASIWMSLIKRASINPFRADLMSCDVGVLGGAAK